DISAGALVVPCQCAPDTHNRCFARVKATYARRLASANSWIFTCCFRVKTSLPRVSVSVSAIFSDQPSTPDNPAHSRTSEAASCSHFGRVSRSPRSGHGRSSRELLFHRSCDLQGKIFWLSPGTKTASQSRHVEEWR